MAEVPQFAAARSTIRSVDFGHVLVLIDYRNGRVRCLLPAAAAHWRDVALTGRLDAMPAALARTLLAGELLTPAGAPAPWETAMKASTPTASWGSIEHQVGLQRPGLTSLSATLSAAGALALVFAVEHAGPADTAMLRVTRLVTAASTCRSTATPAEAATAVRAVRAAAWWSPGRTACLEESAAAVVLLAARRLQVTWCHGIAADPVRLHAWVQTVDGSPVAEPPSTLAYTPVLTLGARHQHP
jgi:hypothetical protein